MFGKEEIELSGTCVNNWYWLVRQGQGSMLVKTECFENTIQQNGKLKRREADGEISRAILCKKKVPIRPKIYHNIFFSEELRRFLRSFAIGHEIYN